MRRAPAAGQTPAAAVGRFPAGVDQIPEAAGQTLAPGRTPGEATAEPRHRLHSRQARQVQQRDFASRAPSVSICTAEIKQSAFLSSPRSSPVKSLRPSRAARYIYRTGARQQRFTRGGDGRCLSGSHARIVSYGASHGFLRRILSRAGRCYRLPRS